MKCAVLDKTKPFNSSVTSHVQTQSSLLAALRSNKLLCDVQPSNMDQLSPGRLLSPVPHGWHGSPLSSCFVLIASPLTASDPPRHPPNCLWIDDEPRNQRRQSDENSARRRERFRSCAADRIAKRKTLWLYAKMKATAVELIHNEGGEGIATGYRQMKTDMLRCDDWWCFLKSGPWRSWMLTRKARRRQRQCIWRNHFRTPGVEQQLHINFTPTSRQLQTCDRSSTAHQVERINKAAGERRVDYLIGWNMKQVIDLENVLGEEEEKERVGVQQNPLLKSHSLVGRLRNRQASR